MLRFQVGSRSVDVPSYQWGYKAGVVYVERELGSTPAGCLYRHKTETDARILVVTFALSDTAYLAPLRELGLHAARTATRVQFFPDTNDLGTFRWIDWPESIEPRHDVEGRLRWELPLAEQVA